MDGEEFSGNEVSGKRVMVSFGGVLTPQLFGSSTFSLESDRLVETSSGIVARQKCQIPIAMISAMAVSTSGNPLFLVFGLLTLPIFGLGLVFLLLYFLLPRHFLVVHSNNYITALNCRGDLQPYREFADAVMRSAIDSQGVARERHGGHRAVVAAPPAMSALPPPSSTVTCPGCGTEYKLPAGVAGRRLRCQKCQSIVGG